MREPRVSNARSATSLLFVVSFTVLRRTEASARSRPQKVFGTAEMCLATWFQLLGTLRRRIILIVTLSVSATPLSNDV